MCFAHHNWFAKFCKHLLRYLGSSNDRSKGDKRVVDPGVGHLIIIAWNHHKVRKCFFGGCLYHYLHLPLFTNYKFTNLTISIRHISEPEYVSPCWGRKIFLPQKIFLTHKIFLTQKTFLTQNIFVLYILRGWNTTHQVGLNLVEVNIERALESERGSHGWDHLEMWEFFLFS